ncbi:MULTISPECIES: hypothetical protein [environmental samples]|uniref:hypothetical protein n=1 Tax=environmental samples TaxID=134245 RepID=UPI00033786CD|nr:MULTISPECIES: hypothetical protein [environmental samples]CCY10644.1 unknown [Porphyromonas sp. CAG:1061]
MTGRIIKIIPLFLLLWLTVSGCSSLDEYYNKGKRVHKSVTSLELGMTKSEVLKVMRYGPDFVNKEALDEGVREILVYRGSYQPYGWMSEPVPMVYHLVIENGVLVVVDSDKDYEQIHINERRRYEEAQKEALKEAEKKKAE